MTALTRRSALKFAGLITLAALQPNRAALGAATLQRGYGTDPSLQSPVVTWQRQLSDDERRLCMVLCELVLPAAGSHPSAAQVGVPDFLDEWVSAPYPDMQRDRQLLAAGLQELERRMRQRHSRGFGEATPAQQREIFESLVSADGELRKFPARFTNLIAGGYYTTGAGYADMGYVGNRALGAFPEPSAETLAQIDAAVIALARQW